MKHQKKAPTLIDTIYRLSFQNEPIPGWASNAAMRTALVAAKRFSLDDKMSSFLGDLATAAFTKTDHAPTRIALVDQLRTSARLPHKSTWIEYNLRASLIRSDELLRGLGDFKVKGKFDPTQAPEREGWLLEEHPKLDTAFRLHLFSESSDPDHLGFDTWTFPFAYGWVADDTTVLPWRTVKGANHNSDPYMLSQIVTGVHGYHTDKVGVINEAGLLDQPSKANSEAYTTLLNEWTGVMRRVWALLATINDIPVLHKEVVSSKGFVAKGRYRKFLSHHTITLNVPEKKDLRKLARHVVALARRRAHEVRGHWRRDYRHPGNRLWIREHTRGDASLGFVIHDYTVKHEIDQPSLKE